MEMAVVSVNKVSPDNPVSPGNLVSPDSLASPDNQEIQDNLVIQGMVLAVEKEMEKGWENQVNLVSAGVLAEEPVMLKGMMTAQLEVSQLEMDQLEMIQLEIVQLGMFQMEIILFRNLEYLIGHPIGITKNSLTLSIPWLP